MPLDRRRFLVLSAAAGLATPAHARERDSAKKLVAAAREQIGLTAAYDPSYAKLSFPGGDVPRDRGASADVVIRAYRDALDIDLQALVNADMRANFARYPAVWGLKGPDTNIDHRRVPNLRLFFARKGAELTVPGSSENVWLPGDIVTLDLSPSGEKRPDFAHIGIVDDESNPAGTHPLVIHNRGNGTQAEDILASGRVTGRYRWLPMTRSAS